MPRPAGGGGGQQRWLSASDGGYVGRDDVGDEGPERRLPVVTHRLVHAHDGVSRLHPCAEGWLRAGPVTTGDRLLGAAG